MGTIRRSSLVSMTTLSRRSARCERVAATPALQVLGSASLARQLVENDLVDEYRLMIEPILLGDGKTIFPSDGRARPMELVSVAQAKTGVIICACRPARSA